MLRKAHTLSLLAIIGTLLMFSNARSQMMNGGFNLKAVLNAGSVDLSWEQPKNFDVSYYLVYRAELGLRMWTTGVPVPINLGYSLIDSTSATEYQDMTAPSADTVFVYMVKAFDAKGQVRLSNTVDVFGNSTGYHRDKVTIVSTPPLNATVGSLYTYQVKAVSSDSTAALKYRLGEHPEPMAIDSTGLINWIPQERGWKEVQIMVTSSKGGEAQQEYTVRVAGIDGKIAGIVTDTLGNPIPHVVVRLYQSILPVMTPIAVGPPFDYQAETDSTGHYSTSHVDEGRYLVHANPLNPNYLPEWYKNVSDIQDATPIEVMDTSTQIADFMLQNRFHQLPKFTVSGVVEDTAGTPVRGAWVVFARAGFVLNESVEDQNEWSGDENFRDFFHDINLDAKADHDFRLDDDHSPYVFKTYVDSNGAYTDTLPEGQYVVFAEANGYYRTFFNGEHSVLSAAILVLVSDTASVNFQLTPIPQIVLGQISGSVLDSTSGAAVAARLIAFRDVWDYRDTLKMHVIGTYFADADSMGAYTFDNLPQGYYKILAVPLGDYAPSFYSLSGPTVRWKDATAIPVNGNSTSGVTIYVMPLPDSASGYVSIAGSVTSSTSKSGVSGAIVYAADANGNIVGYGFTEADGSYTISGMAPGMYSVYADAVGYSSSGSSTSRPAYDASGNAVPSSNNNLTVTPETPDAVNGKPIQPTSFSLEQNYPNPFNPTTQIAFSIPQPEHVTITVYNILGQEVVSLLDGDMSAGAHVITWDARNGHGEILPTGVYFYKLSTHDFTAVKKMLLLK